LLTTKRSSLAITSFFLGSLALGAETIANWPAPASWTPPRARGATTLSETPPLPFIAVSPCRIVDTRGNGAPIQGGIFANSEARNWTVWGICGIPSGAGAISVNFSVVAAGGIPAGSFLLAWPTGQPPPPTAIMTYGPGQILSNAAIVPLSGSGQLTVNVSGSTHVIMDVNGYYSSRLGTPSNFFTLENNSTNYTMFLHNANGTCTGHCGLFTIVDHGSAIWGESTTAGDGVYGISDNASGAGVHGVLTSDVVASTAVWGEHQSTSSSGIGVYGSHAGTGIGVQGISLGTTGINAIGVLGQAFSNSNDTSGVEGDALALTGRTFGVLGITSSGDPNSAGVRGVGAGGGMTGDTATLFLSSGVRGLDKDNIGVLGLSENLGGDFVLFNGAGTKVAQAFLGYNPGTAYGVYANIGTIACNGCTKLFVEPHPADASKVIHYVSLEGNEAGTYFRGTTRTSRGHAVIPVPEDFRLVTDEEGLTVQLTPVGAEASMYVVSEDLNQIVVHSSRDVTFHYLVQGIRPDYKDFKAILEGTEYMPEGPDARMPAAWPEKVKRALISNGTYNADGTINRVTANRLGWDRVWEQRAKAAARAAVAVPLRP
jgi:hypothetical protein